MTRTTSLLALALAACALFALVSLEALQPRARAAATFVVTNTNDSGAGSLRQAVIDANANPGLDTITFQIGTGPQTIRLLSRLPNLTDPVVIDGATQPGYAGAPIVELDGSSAADGSGLALLGGDSTVRGLVIRSFSGHGIFTNVKGGNVVEGCYIGTDMTGTLDRGNGIDGIFVPNSNNRIGGTTPAQRNVISGNNGYGINVSRFCCTGDESPITNNVIQGNYVGVNAAGAAAIPNGQAGVRLSSVNSGVPVTNNAVGGTAAGAGNVISGNGREGLDLDGFNLTNNTVQGNLIGTDATGSFAVPNLGTGVTVTGRNNLVGGSAPGARNVISGNGVNGSGVGGGNGVSLGTLSGNVLRGNVIGANAQLNGPLPNLLHGVSVGGTNTIVGGTQPGEGNVIAFNGSDGVAVGGSTATGNVVRGNAIFSNGWHTPPSEVSIGIDLLGAFGVTPNDAGDADAGGNNLQNFPVITSVTITPGAPFVNVRGTLNSAASTTYDLDFYASNSCDPSGHGEGARRLGSAQVTTDSGGNASFDQTFNVAPPVNQVVTATATDPSGNTSEFSQCAAAGPSAVGSINFEPNFVTVSEGGGVASFVLTRTGGSAGAFNVNYSVRGVTASAGADFTATSGTLSFADGETSKSFTVPVLEDALDEASPETAVVTLSTNGGDLDALGPRSTATLTITDNDPAPTVSVGDVSAAEGNSGTTAFEFPVTLSAVSGRDITVNYVVQDGTASGGGNDYTTPTSSSILIPAGQTSGKITVPVRGDTDSEPDETFLVILTFANAAGPGDTQGQGTILNDDAVPTVSLSVGDAGVTEGNSGTTDATFTVSLSAASASTVKVDVSTADQTTASSPLADLQPLNTTLTFAPGETAKTVTVRVNGDTYYEKDETFLVKLRNPVGAFLGDDTGVGTIVNDDPLPSVSVGDLSLLEGQSGLTLMFFQLNLSSPTAVPIQFRVRTVGNTATPDEDFIAFDTLSSADSISGNTSIIVPVFGDTITEATETFFVDISELTNATVDDPRGVGTIINDDNPARPATLQFVRRALTVSESVNSVTVTVTRSGDPTTAATVDYATRVDEDAAAASDRSDYTAALGTLRFAAGETQKSFNVLLTDDARAESQEFITVVLSNATGGATAGEPAQTRINIDDNDATPSSVNPIDTTDFFVRQHYHDFLNREPDPAGLAFWTNDIEQCGADAQCREVHRISVSQAFFLSIEFQQTGYRVFRFYRATFPDSAARPRGMPRMAEFLRDTQELGRGVVVGAPGWEDVLRQNVTEFARRWVARPETLVQLPESLSAAQYVDKLFSNSGVTPTTQEREEAVAAFGAGGPEGRAAALLSVTDSGPVFNGQYNPAFVYMQYAGYLRRHPADAPDTDFNGFDFWLGKLDSFTQPGEDARDEGVAIRRSQRAEMVKAFLSSTEYRARFGTP
ncbi:MAG TPA: Calx-beta domain-containing protein [Pyrinomonadaceae bacterium]|nr:Calx-beta domain-containing protein [Pyrinomonadaceae bacterium]